jgi:hypothetical protein
MKYYSASLLIAATLFVSSSVHAQTANEIIEKHLAAIGGKEKLATVNTVKIENTMTVMGNEAPNTIIIVNGKGYRSESDMMGQKMIQVYTDKSGWSINPMAGGTSAQKMPDEQAKSGQSQIYTTPFLDYAAKGYTAELAGKEKLGNVEAIKIKMTDKNKFSAFYYFDPSTWYLIKLSKTVPTANQSMELTVSYGDFQKTDFGWVVPHSVDFDFGGQFQMSAKLKTIEINKDVDPKIFDMP